MKHLPRYLKPLQDELEELRESNDKILAHWEVA